MAHHSVASEYTKLRCKANANREQNLPSLGNYAEMQLCLSKVSTILPHSPIWFVIYPHWFVNAAFCTSKHPTTVKNARQIITFLPKLLHNSNKSRTFASTELVCIPSELQASHFFIINYESESKNNSAADSHTQIKRDGFQRRKPRHLISDKNQLFPSKVLLDGYD